MSADKGRLPDTLAAERARETPGREASEKKEVLVGKHSGKLADAADQSIFVRTFLIKTPAHHGLQRISTSHGKSSSCWSGERVAIVEPRLVQGGLAPWQYRIVIAHVESHIAQPIRIETLASLTRLSVSHFTRAFKATFEDTPYNYILGKRIERAQGMMLQSEDVLSHIALACGFADQAHLCNLFRRFVGSTPLVWRRMNRDPSAGTGSREWLN